ncbi:hypothetical protein ACFLTP_01810 [Chloroflexota bacterium]
MSLILSGLIQQAIAHDQFIGAIIYGSQRTGKSSYASKVMYEIYQDWDKVNQYMLFKLEDVVRVLEDATDRGVKIPCFCWDDCGVHGNNLLYFSNRDLVQYLGDLLDVAGISVSGVLMTTPSPLKLLKVIRGYEFYRVKVTSRNTSTGRRAVGYKSILLPSGTRMIKREYEDMFSVMLPDSFWDRYVEKRRSYLAEGLRRLRSVMHKDELER